MQDLITKFLNYIFLERGLSKNAFLVYKLDAVNLFLYNKVLVSC